SVQAQLDDVRSALIRYLQGVRIKSGFSKHSLMGPIGKILSEIRNGRRDPASLKGYALRVQDQSGTRASVETVAALDSGITQLIQLFASVPLSYHDQILDRLDYGIYFDLQKARLLQKEAVRKRWLDFLVKKYVSIDRLAEAWNEPVTSFEALPIFKKASGEKGKNDSAKKQDIRTFWSSELAGSEIVDEEE
ncbi:MAG: hypothetical protein ACRD3W_23295, partial [Terriglobales bacterium]